MYPAPIPPAEPWSYELQFPRDPRGPRVARLTLRMILTAHELGDLSERAELLTSELATNAVCHTTGPAAVRLSWRSPALRVSVYDTSATLPVVPGGQLSPASPESIGGRGLLLLDVFADSWGGYAVQDGPWGEQGKTVWFELARKSMPPPATATATAVATAA